MEKVLARIVENNVTFYCKLAPLFIFGFYGNGQLETFPKKKTTKYSRLRFSEHDINLMHFLDQGVEQ